MQYTESFFKEPELWAFASVTNVTFIIDNYFCVRFKMSFILWMNYTIPCRPNMCRWATLCVRRICVGGQQYSVYAEYV